MLRILITLRKNIYGRKEIKRLPYNMRIFVNSILAIRKNVFNIYSWVSNARTYVLLHSWMAIKLCKNNLLILLCMELK